MAVHRLTPAADHPGPPLGLGCAPLGNMFRARSDEEVEQVLEAAWEAGVRYFDTAPHYGLGLSERRLGRFLATKPRDEFVLSTKVGRLLRPDPDWDGASSDPEGFVVPARLRRHWDFGPEGIRAGLADSLDRLGLDRVDVLYLHDPEHSGDPRAAVDGMAALAELRAEGLVSSVGVGSMDPAALTAAVETGLADVVMVANRYTLLDQSALPELLPACERHGTAVVAAAVFNSGLLARSPSADATFDYRRVPEEVLARARRIEAVCAAHGVELPAAALRYPLLDPRVAAVVVGADSAGQVRENVARLGAPIPAGLWDALAAEGLAPRHGGGAVAPSEPPAAR
ncbi:aldo/keto reductase [Kitasatospora sp. NA04385]|uniref:aldo/keto reductase n=1 Tax=Kitasatospora sp. NA04385 TaxID=2742135 RepID=UPI001591192F|nr:aldo/keto reductase [Kitasatospora sp. NA04385]QKW17737.1 aldo/keto reductase [Kitasatospora sp. NA04385]